MGECEDADIQRVEIGKKLKLFFKDLGYTQQAIADKLGVSQAVVSAMLNGKPFGKNFAKKWGDAFGLKPNWLLTGEGAMTKDQQHIGDVKNSTIVNGNVNGNNVTINKTETDKFLEVLKKSQEQLDKSQEQIDRLIGIIEQFKK